MTARASLDSMSAACRAAAKKALAEQDIPKGKTWHWNHPREEWVEGKQKHPPYPDKKKPAIRMPKARLMSAAERQYLYHLESEFPDETILYEGLTFRLKSGCLYCADFTVWNRSKLLLVCEVKGSYRLQSAGRSHLAFKTAVSEWPSIQFRYAAKQKDGSWAVQNFNV